MASKQLLWSGLFPCVASQYSRCPSTPAKIFGEEKNVNITREECFVAEAERAFITSAYVDRPLLSHMVSPHTMGAGKCLFAQKTEQKWIFLESSNLYNMLSFWSPKVNLMLLPMYITHSILPQKDKPRAHPVTAANSKARISRAFIVLFLRSEWNL